MNESISEMDSLVWKQANGVIPIGSQVFNGDLPASQQHRYLSRAEERQADEYIAAWEQHNVPWTLGSYLDSLQRSPQTPVAIDYSFTSSSFKPDGHYGQHSDCESCLIAPGTGQMPAMNANQKKIPKSSLAGPAKRQAANRHPAQIRTVAAYTLPTGEVIREQQMAIRFHFVDFPPITQPLPEDVEDEDIIKHWPNHLWGPLLLKLAETWKPTEISHMTPVNLTVSAICKRLEAARIQRGKKLPKTGSSKRKTRARKRAPLDEHQVTSQPETELEDNQAFRINNARAMELENVRQSDWLQKRRKSHR